MAVKRLTAEEAVTRLDWLRDRAAQEIEDLLPWIEGQSGYEGYIVDDDYDGDMAPVVELTDGLTWTAPVITKSAFDAMPEHGDYDIPDAVTIEKLREISRVASEVALYYEGVLSERAAAAMGVE